MPDPISVIASGLTVLQVIQTIAQASALLYGYVASVRNADSSCQSLLNELSAVGGVLTTVMVIEKDGSLPPNLSHALSFLMAVDGPVANLLAELKSILPNEQARENGKMKTISRLTWPFKEKEVGAIIDKLKSYCGEITQILAIDTWNTLKEVDRGVKEANQGIQELKAHKKTEERRKLLEWMNPIFHANEYKTWNTSECAFLWLNGQPGHGKTILAQVRTRKVFREGSDEAEPQTLAYFYCNFRDDRTTNAAAVLRSLIVQLLQQSQDDDWITQIGEKQESNTEGDLDSLRNLWQQQRDAKPHPTDLVFLRKLLTEASTLVHRPVLLIDALDECKDYPDLVRHLVNLAEDARLRLFVTGRSEPEIQDAFDDLPTVSLKDSAEQMKADICAHITEQLKAQKKLSRLSDALKKTILEKLLEKAEGMFRWVQCQLDVITTCKRRIDIEAALDDLPAGLYETYDRIIQAIKQRGPSDDQIARSCLLWLAGTFTPLTLDQLNEAMMIEVGQSNLNPDLGVMDLMDIVAACGSLVTYDEKTGVVALSHYSVKEYLISRPNELLKSTSDMHARICKLLITYVLCDFVDEICARLELEESKQAAIRHAIHHCDGHVVLILPIYAILGWKHLGHVSDEDPDVMDALSRLNSEFLRNTKKHRVLAGDKYMSKSRWLPAGATLPSLLFIPLEHGKSWMVESLVKQHPDLLDVDIAPGWGSPLIFAIAKSPDCLSILLKPGVDLNKLYSFSPDLYGQYIGEGDSHAPISWAAVTGSEVAMDFLLSRTEVDIPNDILYMAVRAMEPSHESIRKFRRRGADVNFTVYGSTPIHYVLSPDTLEYLDESQLLPIVKALVEPSCDLSLQDRTARTVLHSALDERLEDVVTYLLEQNAGLSATATLHPDMWSWATNKAWFPKVQAAALAAAQPCTRIKGKVVEATEKSKIVEFSVAVTADCDNPNPICAVVVSAIRNGEVSNSPKDDSRRFDLYFGWKEGSVSLVSCSTIIKKTKLSGCYSS
ncbi:hypothetical protein EV702DRAFT_1217465 [Suillus placidus]|uniref:NACHT domain-containing protein n=1 Tax=Suillus placidus TaxID=48579 RepID=A0A9P6ZXV8_9AGAM|nr:hypothetical protein EV702DRAFT_1217465 [Suillus placidus]